MDTGLPFEVIAVILISACEGTAEDIGVNPVICNGTIMLQGEHVSNRALKTT